MPLTAERKKQLLAMGLENDGDMIRRARAFALQAGLTYGELAELAGLNLNTFRVWIAGNYDRHHIADSNTLNIRAAIKATMDRYEIANPVRLSERHYSTAEYEAVRQSMLTALQDGTALLVDGPPGSRKTYTFQRVGDEINSSGLGKAVYVYSRIEHSPQTFLIEACTEAGIPTRGTIGQLLRKLRFFLGGRRTLLMVDEAQHLPLATLEILRQLLDNPPYFGVVIGGSHDLWQRLRCWQMEQWRSRLRRTHLLNGPNKAEAAAILAAELGTMHPEDVSQTIQDAVRPSARQGAEFEYISARNLFFAIKDARSALGEDRERPSVVSDQKVEAIA